MKKVSDFGDLGGDNDADILQLAFDYAKQYKTPLQLDYVGTLNLTKPVNYVTDSLDVFSPGLSLVGCGADKTIINNLHGQESINIGTTAQYKFQRHGVIEGLTFSGPGTGIKIKSSFNYQLNGLQFSDHTEYGIYLPTSFGDSDACNMISINDVRIDNAAKWGIYCEVAPGVNELSFLKLSNVFINNCGSKSGEVGGGMYWRGQNLRLDSVAFVLCKNRGLYIEGGAGLGSDIYGSNVTFENNEAKHIQCYGGKNFVFDNLQMYSSDQYKVAYGVWCHAGSSVIQNFLVRSAKVRATAANNPYVAFFAVGSNASNLRAQNIAWDNFGYNGQVQMQGFTA